MPVCDCLSVVGMSLLHWACDRGHLDITQLLIRHKANINIVDHDGQTPLHYACACGHFEIARFLLASRADPTVPDSDGVTPRDVAEGNVLSLIESYT